MTPEFHITNDDSAIFAPAANPPAEPWASVEDFAVPRWYAAYILPRHEKAVAEQLARKYVETYLPLYRAVRRWRDRRVEVEWPLFPGYVFVRIPLLRRVRVLEHPSVLRIVGAGGHSLPLPEGEIEALKASLAIRAAEPCPFLTTGKRVRIQRGPLQGLEGRIARRKGRLRLIVSIDSIQRSVALEIDVSDVQLA